MVKDLLTAGALKDAKKTEGTAVCPWVEMTEPQQNITLHRAKKNLFLPPIVKTPSSHWLDVAGFQFVQIRQKHGYQDDSISTLVLKCIMGLTTCDLTADIHLKKKKRASLSQTQSGFHECHKWDNGCILPKENGTGALNDFKAI